MFLLLLSSSTNPLRIQSSSLDRRSRINQTGNTVGEETNKQGNQADGSRPESSLQMTSSPGRDSEEKTKKQKTKKSKEKTTEGNHIVRVKNKTTPPTLILLSRLRKKGSHISRGRQTRHENKDKDNECGTQQNRNEGGGKGEQ